MRLAGAVLALSMAVVPATALAQQAGQADATRLAEAKKKAAPKAKTDAKKGKAESKKGKADAKKPKAEPRPGAYATMPVSERAAIQYDLAWTGHYTGPVDGD